VTGLLGRRRGAALLLAAWGLVSASACANTTPSRRSALQQKAGKNGVSALELRLRIYELPGQLGSMIETAADQIRAESSDPAARRHALLWKADGIPALYTAALRPDPLAGGIDLWLLLEQMNLYFVEGAGKNAFGAQQPLATATTARMLLTIEKTAASMATDTEARERAEARIQEFARSHPIEGAISSRDTALIVLAKLSDAEKTGMFASVGQATESVSDISLRLNAYVSLVPKVARWQVELAAEEVMGRENLRGTLGDVQAVGATARSLNSVLADIPGTARAASVPVREMLDQQRTEVMTAVQQERLAVTESIAAELKAALAAISEERRAALAGLSEERVAMLSELDAMTQRSIEDASSRARDIADYVFVRALILIAAAALMFAVAYRLARGRLHRGERID